MSQIANPNDWKGTIVIEYSGLENLLNLIDNTIGK